MTRALSAGVCALTLSACGVLSGLVETPDPRHAVIADLPERLAVEDLWATDIGDGDAPDVVLRSLLAGPVVYAADADGRVSARRIEDGRVLWRKELDETVSFALGGGRRLLALGVASGAVVALAPESGDELWRAKLGAPALAISALHRDTLVVRTADRRIVALDAQEGRVVWTVEDTPGVLTIRGVGIPLMERNAVFVGLGDGHLAVFDLRSGETLNRVRIGVKPRNTTDLDQVVDIDGRLVIDDGVLFVSAYRGPTLAIDLRQWRVLWSARDLGSYSGPTVTQRTVYVVETDGGVTALDRLSGEVKWRNALLEVKRLDAPAVTARHVVVGDDEGHVYWLSKRTGDILKRDRAGSGAVLSLHGLPNERLAVLTADGDLGVFRARAPEK